MILSAGVRVGPYEIVDALGSGGMGIVFKARDTRLNRYIAIKTLPDDRVLDAGDRRRFLREAQTASQLNHPNIVTVHESLEEDGTCFLVMEYVTGSTLEAVLSRRTLSVDEVLSYAAQIADGLAAAHHAGIIHRDLKPGNIMITDDGRVKLLDFGLARFTGHSQSGDPMATTRTLEGVVLGTVPYMSPEQAEGHPLDARSDIFSFGCVLYEMLSRRQPFRRDSWAATAAAILSAEPTPLRQLRPSVPALLEEYIGRCLRKSPKDRSQTIAEARRALAVVSLNSQPRSEKLSIAVLPFTNLSADKENEYFSDGLTEELLNMLTKIPELRVIARASAFALRGHAHDLSTIAQRLRVQTILEGSVRRAGNRIRVSAQLIKVEDESHLWSERYDRELNDVFAIQDEISQEIASALKVKLGPRESRTTHLEAYQSYLKGLYWYQRYTAESLALARESFERALALDPGYAQAHAGLAVFYYSIGALSIRRMSDVCALARSAAERALSLDPESSDALSVLGLIAGAVGYDWKAAETHFGAATAREPVSPLVSSRYALYSLLPMKRYDEALAQYHRALETDPLSMMVHFGLSFVLYCSGQYTEAVENAARALELYPDYWLVHFAMGMAQCQTGACEAAIASLEKGLQLSPLFALATGYLAAAYAKVGDSVRAEELMEELTRRKARSYVSPSAFAVFYAATGQVDPMFENLAEALGESEPFLTRMDSEPYFWPYRSDPRYQALLRSMQLS